MLTDIFIQGLVTGIALIFPIGPQNAFVLRQGIQKNHRFITAAACSGFDCILFYMGIMGAGAYIVESPVLMNIALWGGSAFLLFFAFNCFKRSLTGSVIGSEKDDEKVYRPSLKVTLVTVTAVTLLNPHSYLDALVFVGSIGSQFGENRMVFAYGAITGSFLWFFTLAYGAMFLEPLFRNPKAWKILDFLIGCLMLWIVYSLLSSDILSDGMEHKHYS